MLPRALVLVDEHVELPPDNVKRDTGRSPIEIAPDLIDVPPLESMVQGLDRLCRRRAHG